MTQIEVVVEVADLATLNAALEGEAQLAQHLGCPVTPDWSRFPEAIPYARDALAADLERGRWGARLFFLDDPRQLVGWGGFKAAPVDGVVELGYSVGPEVEGRGIAKAAVAAMLREAWAAEEVVAVTAHTLGEVNGSVRVLEASGFARDGESIDDDVGTVWRWRIDRP